MMPFLYWAVSLFLMFASAFWLGMIFTCVRLTRENAPPFRFRFQERTYLLSAHRVPKMTMEDLARRWQKQRDDDLKALLSEEV